MSVTTTSPAPQTVSCNRSRQDGDAIDFPCAPIWVRHYAAHGMTQGYPPELDYRAPEPEPLPLPDPCHTIQEFNRYHHLDLPNAQADMERELRQIANLENADEWFAERILMLQEYLRPAPAPMSDEPFEPTRTEPERKGIDI